MRPKTPPPGEGAYAVVWDELIGRTAGLTAVGELQIFLTIARLPAAIAVITDSPVTVGGALVLGPEFGPLATVAAGLVRPVS